MIESPRCPFMTPFEKPNLHLGEQEEIIVEE